MNDGTLAFCRSSSPVEVSISSRRRQAASFVESAVAAAFGMGRGRRELQLVFHLRERHSLQQARGTGPRLSKVGLKIKLFMDFPILLTRR